MTTVTPKHLPLRLALLFMVTLVLSGCNKQKQESVAVWGGPIPATVMKAEKRKVVEWDEYTGRFVASKRVEVRARVSGYLNDIKFNDGELVEEGQVLFVIDPRPFEIEVDGAQAQHERVLKEFERAKNLRKSKAISQEDYDVRLQEMRVAKATLDRAKLNLEFTNISAPFNGHISRHYVDVGNLISGGSAEGTLLTTIVKTKPINFYFEGSESDVLRYIRLYKSGARTGDRGGAWPVEVKLHDENAFIHKGSINFVDNELDVDTGTKEIRAEFENIEGLLEPGLFGRLRISSTEAFDALLVPDTIIGTEQTQKYVYVVGEENKAVRKYLMLGTLEKDGLRIIKSGLEADDQVIVGNLQKIQPGVVIDPIASDVDPLVNVSVQQGGE